MESDVCPMQHELREAFKKSAKWHEYNALYNKTLFPALEKAWGLQAGTLNFSSAYGYVDNFVSANFNMSSENF